MASFLNNHSPSASIPKSTGSPLQYFASPNFLSNFLSSSWLYTSLAVIVALLILEQSVYRYKKGRLPGSRWTIPIIGKFADSMRPSIEGYQRQWDSGELSAISVFNMYVSFFYLVSVLEKLNRVRFIVMASTNDYTRKILNSPTYAEPCLVASAKQVLCADNWYAIKQDRLSSYLTQLLGYSSPAKFTWTFAAPSIPCSHAKHSGQTNELL
jgi:sterol 22-desaturase